VRAAFALALLLTGCASRPRAICADSSFVGLTAEGDARQLRLCFMSDGTVRWEPGAAPRSRQRW